MNDTERWQADAVRSARTRDLPTADALERMWGGLEERIANGAADPLGEDTHTPVTPAYGQRWRAWTMGGLLAAAAALALSVGLRSTLASQAETAPNTAAAYDAQSDTTDNEAVPRRPRAAQGTRLRPAATPTATPVVEAAAPVPPLERLDPVPKPPAGVAPPAVSRARARAASPPKSPPAPPTNVAGEAEALRKAHAAMEAGRLGDALDELRTYQTQFPKGVLKPEAAGLRVLIGCKRDRDGAPKRARAFLLAYPTSVLRPRLESACENLEDDETDPSVSRH